MSTKSVRLLALAASVAFAACGETTDLEMGELTEAEAQDLAGAILFATFASTGDVPQPVSALDGPQPAPFEYSEDVDFTVECPLGGSVGVEASVDAQGDSETGEGSVEYSMTQTHNACGVMSENQRQFELTGAPSLSLDFLVESNGQGVVEWGGAVQGAIQWSTDDRSGTCTTSFEFSGRVEAETSLGGDLAGSVCGFNVQRSFTFGAQ